MPDVSPPPPSLETGRASFLLAIAAGILVLLPNLLFSSPEFRAYPLLAFGVVGLIAARWIPSVAELFRGPRMRVASGLVLLMQASALVGGLVNGGTVFSGVLAAILAILPIGGMACLAVIGSQPPWSRRCAMMIFALLAVLVVSSLAGFLVFIDWHIALGAREAQLDPRRLALIWPTRWLASGIGQEFWTHANAASYLFGIGWVLLVDRLATRPRFSLAGWILAGLLIVAIFLTASRTGWLVVGATLPVLAVGRDKTFNLKLLLAVVLGLAVGFAGLESKIGRLRAASAASSTPGAYDQAAELHLGGLVERGGAGRVEHYNLLWHQLEGTRLFGRGLAIGRTRVGPIGHEHSSYLATLRSGGFIALAAELALIAVSLAAALQLARCGRRWPLLFAIAVFGGLLFDRSTVLRVTGFDEFPTFWLAIWIPVILLAFERPAEIDR